MSLRPIVGSALVAMLGVVAHAQQVTTPTVAGVRNFAKLESTIACGGATTPEAVAELKKLGYKSIINVRQASETGANVEASAAAAQQAGIKYVHLPMSGQSPEAAVADRFLEAVQEPANQPVFVHCATGNRAAALWMVKRLVVDGWDADRAGTEAAALGLSNPGLKKFAIDYAASRKK